MTDWDVFVAWLAAHPMVTFGVTYAVMRGVIMPLSDRIGPL